MLVQPQHRCLIVSSDAAPPHLKKASGGRDASEQFPNKTPNFHSGPSILGLLQCCTIHVAVCIGWFSNYFVLRFSLAVGFQFKLWT